MHRIRKYGIGHKTVAKSTLTAFAALLFASAFTALTPSGASAQFGNIDGLIRGALGARGYRYRPAPFVLLPLVEVGQRQFR